MMKIKKKEYVGKEIVVVQGVLKGKKGIITSRAMHDVWKVRFLDGTFADIDEDDFDFL